jgi:hypothetical protein
MKVSALAPILLLCPVLTYAQKISAKDAASHEGEYETVCGTVASEHTAASSKGEPTFINLDAPYPHQVFTILIWIEDLRKVGKLPPMGSHVCVSGTITDYRGVPEMVVRSAGQISR